MYHSPLFPHIKYLPSFVCGDADNPETRTDAGEQGERGEGSSELGVAVFAVGEPAKLELKYCLLQAIYLCCIM